MISMIGLQSSYNECLEGESRSQNKETPKNSPTSTVSSFTSDSCSSSDRADKEASNTAEGFSAREKKQMFGCKNHHE